MAPSLLIPPAARVMPARTTFRAGLAYVLLIFAVTRLVIWSGAYAGAFMDLRLAFSLTSPLEKHRAQIRTSEFVAIAGSAEYLGNLKPVAKWDGSHYRDIIENGYQYRVPGPDEHLQQNIAFFPLYPLVTWPLAEVLGNTPLAMILVANTTSLLAIVILYTWLRARLGHPTALAAAALACCFPSACYLAFAYAECLMFLGIVLMALLIDRGRWLPAALVCGITTAARPTAIVLVPVLLLAYWFASNKPPERRLAGIVGLGLLGGSGIALYALYLTLEFGSPFVYSANFENGWIHDEQRASWLQYLTFARVWDQFKYFGRALALFPAGLVNLTLPQAWNIPLSLFMIFISLAAWPQVASRWRPLLLIAPLIFLQAYFASGGATFGIIPIARYMSMAVPTLIVLASWMVHGWQSGWKAAFFAWLVLVQFFWAFSFGLDEWPG